MHACTPPRPAPRDSPRASIPPRSFCPPSATNPAASFTSACEAVPIDSTRCVTLRTPAMPERTPDFSASYALTFSFARCNADKAPFRLGVPAR
jgi:hypothetical protein